MDLSTIKCFEIDVLPFYLAIKSSVSNLSRKAEEYTCTPCCKQILVKDVVRHVFSNHSTRIRMLRRLAYKSTDGSHFVCICGFTLLSFDLLRFVNHFISCLGFRKFPSKLVSVIDNFKTTDTYLYCCDIIKMISTENQDEQPIKETSVDNSLDTYSDIDFKVKIKSLEENLSFTDTIDEHLEYIFNIKKTTTPGQSEQLWVSYKKRAHLNLRNHVSQYLFECVAPNGINCKHCSSVISSLHYITHNTTEHLDKENYGIETLICPNCLNFTCKFIYTSGYHYACMLIHIVECILDELKIVRDDHYKKYIENFNLICLRAATHSPYVINKKAPLLETAMDKYFSIDELLYTARPGNDGSLELGKETIRRMFNLGEADLHDNFSDYKRVHEEVTVPCNNGECDICHQDMLEMKSRITNDITMEGIEKLLTREEFLNRYPGNVPTFIRPSGEVYIEPIVDISGIKLFMIESAARLPNCNPRELPEDKRDKYLYAAHVYVFQLKASSIFDWLDKNSHRVFVFPNSTLCWSTSKIDLINDPRGLSNVHRHLILIFDKFSTYEEFAAKEFEIDSEFKDLYNLMISNSRKNKNKSMLPVSKVCKLIYSIQHLFGATIYISRFKIHNNTPWGKLYHHNTYYDYNDKDSCSDDNEHHQMTRLMSRHAKSLSYAFYQDGLADWYTRSRIYKEILWLTQVSGLRSFTKPPPSSFQNVLQNLPIRSDLSNLYIPLSIAKSVLPGYFSNHPVNLLPYDRVEYMKSIDYLRSFGGIFLQINSSFLYSDHEFCYVRLSKICAKRLTKYIQTVTDHVHDFSNMLVFNSAATDIILAQKKLIDQYRIILAEKKLAESK